MTKTPNSRLLDKKSTTSKSLQYLQKDSWLAVNLSLFFPGMGQMYAEKFNKSLIWTICQAFLLVFGFWSIFSASGKVSIGLACLGIALIIYLINILDAFLTVHEAKNDKNLEKIPRIHKNPWFAIFVSRFLPGLGQLYNGKTIAGLLFLFAFTFFKYASVYPILAVIPPLISAIAVYHAYLTFPSSSQKLTDRSLVALMAGIIFAWGIMCSSYFPNWLNQKLFVIPSESMQPTLQIDDRIFVDKQENYTPKRGDIVVFKTPYIVKQLDPTSGEFYIKRAIAQPGETVFVHRGTVYINNQPLEENYITQPPEYEWGPATVPTDSYFVLGDNRNASFDSHVWGFLPKVNIYGQAYKICWPLNRVRSLLN